MKIGRGCGSVIGGGCGSVIGGGCGNVKDEPSASDICSREEFRRSWGRGDLACEKRLLVAAPSSLIEIATSQSG